MTLNEYQEAAYKTAIYPGKGNDLDGVIYCSLKLNGEAGEVAEIVGKTIRGDFKELPATMTIKELGDVLWYVSAIAKEMAVPLDRVAQINLDKLRDRQERGVLQGSGSDR